ncbi:MAG: glycosyltransferase family 2 protein [Candidatus Zixiibacteriota bacterium]
MSQPASVSIVIVTYNSSSVIAPCLFSILALTGNDILEIIVVDNHSADETVALIAQNFPSVKVINSPDNVGFAAACNLGAKTATGAFLLFLNPDVVLDPDAISLLLIAAGSRKKVGAVTGRLRFPDGRFQANCRKFPTIGNMLFSRGSIAGKLLLNHLGLSHVYTLPDYTEVTEVPAVAGTVLLIRRDLFLIARGFDQRFFLFMEDTDLCRRLSYSGYTNLYVPQAGAEHQWGRGSRTGHIVRAWHHHQSVWRYFLKHYPNGFSLILLPAILSVNLLLTCLIPPRRK